LLQPNCRVPLDERALPIISTAPIPQRKLTAQACLPTRRAIWRRIATRYDKLAQNFLAANDLVGALYWIKSGA
jgi:hypothetical protein